MNTCEQINTHFPPHVRLLSILTEVKKGSHVKELWFVSLTCLEAGLLFLLNVLSLYFLADRSTPYSLI